MPGVGIPRCQLKVEFKEKGEKTPILKDISLLGAKYPHNFFTLDLSTFCNTGIDDIQYAAIVNIDINTFCL